MTETTTSQAGERTHTVTTYSASLLKEMHPDGFRRAHSAGHVPPCPFTGYCADEDYMDALRKAVCNGDTLKEAFESLADTCAELLESEAENQSSEEYFLDHAEANEFEFEEDGSRF